MKVLITGATGNVGKTVIECLLKNNPEIEIFAGIRDLQKDSKKFSNERIQFVEFDFTNIGLCQTALKNCDVLFLLRPPNLSDVEKYFDPIIDSCERNKVSHIIFLSVQGVENSKIIPHHKIEKRIQKSKIPYTFLRPAYFMQNFTTTLSMDLMKNSQIFLPAGNAKFTLVDVEDLGWVTAKILENKIEHVNKSYSLTSHEKLTFTEMAKIISDISGRTIRFISPNLLQFYRRKRKEKMPKMLILVMIMLHYFPRFQKTPPITDCIFALTGKQPTSFELFISKNKTSFASIIPLE